MVKAIDVANFFIEMMQYDEDKLTNLKLNKMLYYAQGHSLKRLGRRLFDEEIQAWDYGPVVASVYQAFKQYGTDGIEQVCGEFSADHFTEGEQRLLLDVGRVYGQYTGTALVRKTHVKGSPWDQVYDPNVKNIIIPIDSIERYFNENEECEPFEIVFKEEDYIDHVDDKGRYVLPKEWDDENDIEKI